MKTPWVVVLIVANLASVLTSNIGLKLSAWALDWHGVLAWQIFGNLTGFLGVLAFTALMRFVPLNVGYGITAGIGFILVQVVGAHLFFHEPITPLQWLGVAAVTLGIALIASGIKNA